MPATQRLKLSHVLWSAVRQWGTRLGSVAVFLVLARILDKQQLGLFSATIAILAIAELLAENGLGDAVVQAAEIDDRLLSAAMLVNLGMALVLGLSLLAAAPALEAYFATPGLALLLSVMLVTLLLNAACYIPQSVLRRQFAFRWLAMRALIAMGVSGVIGIALALGGYGAWSMVAQAILFSGIGCILVWSRAPFDPFARPALAALAPLLRFSGTILAGRGLYYVCTRMIELVILARFGAAVLSLYIIGSRIYFVCTQLLTAVLIDVAFSALSRLADDRRALEHAFFRTLGLATVVTVPVFLGLSVIAPELCRVAFGAKGPEAAPFLAIVALFGTLQVAQFYFGSTLSAIGRPLVATAIGAFQALVSALILLPPWRLDAVTLVALNTATLLLSMPCFLVACQRYAGLDARRILAAMAPVYAAGGVMVAAVHAARMPLLAPLPSPLLRGAVLAALGGAVFIAALAALAPATLKAVWQWRRPRQGATR